MKFLDEEVEVIHTLFLDQVICSHFKRFYAWVIFVIRFYTRCV